MHETLQVLSAGPRHQPFTRTSAEPDVACQRKTKDRADGWWGKKVPIPLNGIRTVTSGIRAHRAFDNTTREARLASVEKNTSDASSIVKINTIMHETLQLLSAGPRRKPFARTFSASDEACQRKTKDRAYDMRKKVPIPLDKIRTSTSGIRVRTRMQACTRASVRSCCARSCRRVFVCLCVCALMQVCIPVCLCVCVCRRKTKNRGECMNEKSPSTFWRDSNLYFLDTHPSCVRLHYQSRHPPGQSEQTVQTLTQKLHRETQACITKQSNSFLHDCDSHQASLRMCEWVIMNEWVMNEWVSVSLNLFNAAMQRTWPQPNCSLGHTLGKIIIVLVAFLRLDS